MLIGDINVMAMHFAFAPSELAFAWLVSARRRSHFVLRCGSQPGRNSRSWQLIPGSRLGENGEASWSFCEEPRALDVARR